MNRNDDNKFKQDETLVEILIMSAEVEKSKSSKELLEKLATVELNNDLDKDYAKNVLTLSNEMKHGTTFDFYPKSNPVQGSACLDDRVSRYNEHGLRPAGQDPLHL